MRIVETFYTNTALIKLREDGIVETDAVVPRDNDEQTLADVKENYNVLSQFKGKDTVLLVNVVYGQFSQEARKFIKQSDPIFKKVALVADGAFQKMMSNFYVGNMQPKGVNIESFETKEAAEKWLLAD